MAQYTPIGRSSSVSQSDFNERVSRLLKDKPDPRKADERRRNRSTKPFQRPGQSS